MKPRNPRGRTKPLTPVKALAASSMHSSDHGREFSERAGSGPFQLAEGLGELGGGRGGGAAPGPFDVEFGARMIH